MTIVFSAARHVSVAVIACGLIACGTSSSNPPPEMADLAVGPDLAGPPPCDPPRPGNPAGDTLVTEDGLGVNVRPPDSYQPSVPAPLLMVFAPAGADAVLTERFTGLTSPANQRGWIVAYADHVTPMTVGDIESAAKAIPTVLDQYCVDPQRIYVTGHSDGGSVTEVSAAQAFAPITAIAPSAAGTTGALMAMLGCPAAPVPVMEIHSSGDQLFPVGRGFGADVAAWWADCDKCNPTPSDPDDDNCITYSGCAAGTEVRYCEGTAAHGVWPKLNRQMLDFLERFTVPR